MADPAIVVGSTAGTRRPWMAVAAAVNAVAAWIGAIGLITGFIDVGDRLADRMPFGSPVVGGLALAFIVAAPLTALAWAAWTGSRFTNVLVLISGVLLIGWIVVQLALLRAFSLFQPTYLIIGIGFVMASHRVHVGRRARGLMLIAAGAVLLAVGVGLLPHIVKTGASLESVVSAVLLVVGVALVVVGGRGALHAWRRLLKVAGGFGAAVLVALVVWVIAPGVAATNVPPTDITTTPADQRLDAESVTLTTDDGVELAAWYLPGTNGAGVLVRHGAGSTRSNVLDQSAVFAEAGYSILMLDARGHGDSGGTAMDLGWYGDLDIAAGTDFLATRPEVDPGRIGVVGFSMGGEEAIGAAANNPMIRAVVAEGATGRQADDKAWMSDVFGWRGWVQEQIEHVQFGVTDLLTDASPPVTLRSAVGGASNTRFLLTTAGNVDDETHAAEYIQSAAPERVEVWIVDGADHTGGLDTQPAEWRRRVLAFLDDALA